MVKSITQQVVMEVLRELPAHEIWQDAYRAELSSKRTLPETIDISNRDHLQAQSVLLDSQDEETSARAELMVEIAEQDDNFLPLVHRLGLLAVFDKFKEQNMFSMNRIAAGLISREDQITPSHNHVVRAIQIGDELTAVSEQLQHKGPLPVTMVENKYCRNCREHYNLVAGGSIAKPEHALKIEEPQVILEDGTKKASYEVPTALHGVGNLRGLAGHIAVGFYRAEPLNYSTKPVKGNVISPPIPRLVKLVGNGAYISRKIDALYLGVVAEDRFKVAELKEQSLMQPRRSLAFGNSRRARRRYR